MGGRGQNYSVVKRLKNFKNAKFSRNKFKNYLLNPSKDPDKAKFFNSLGYNMKNYNLLVNDIKYKISKNKALKYETDEYGNTAYQVNMELGITKKAMVATGWIVRKGETVPQFVTAYHNEKYERRNRK